MKTSSNYAPLAISFFISCLLWSCEEEGSKPIANFNIQNSGCKFPCTITFINSSQNANSYHWDFGDGTQSTEQNPSHEYVESGEYTVTLTATGPEGEDSFSLPILITSDPVILTGIYPNSNPVGGPVLIEGEGFTEETEVYFNNTPATIEKRSSTYITTKVPAGLGATTVTLRVETGIMFDEEPFDVLSAFPSNIPGSPPSIIIIPPGGGVTSPISFTLESTDKITVVNVYDPSHILDLVVRVDPRLEGIVVSKESITIDGALFTSPLTFDEDPYFDFDIFNQEFEDMSISSLEIDRSKSDPSGHPYENDKLFGEFVTIEDYPLPADLLENKPECMDYSSNFLLLTSSITGRQYLFVVLSKIDFEGECGF